MDHATSVFGYLNTHNVATVPEKEYHEWASRQKTYFLDKTKEVLEKSKEFFFLSSYDDELQNLCIHGVGTLKLKCSNYAEAKSIIVDPGSNDKETQNRITNLIAAMEKYCSENGYEILDIYTNDFNLTAPVVRCKSAYALAAHYKTTTGIDEYVYRRQLAVDYGGDPINWRDMCLWYLDSTFCQSTISPLRVGVYDEQKEIRSFTSSEFGYMSGDMQDGKPLKFTLYNCNNNTKSVQGINVVALIHNGIGNDILLQQLISKSTLSPDFFVVFTHEFEGNNFLGIKVVTWQDVFLRILEVRTQHLQHEELSYRQVK